MTSFSSAQLRKLTAKLDRAHVQSRKMDEREVDYIEGWFAIAEANAIFGFGGWDREMTQFERVFERSRGDATSCSYLARVRIRVRAGAHVVVREGTGWGAASAKNPADAHERAIKAAETDATKRALATFGNRFGLGLYDREQAGVTPRSCTSPNNFVITAPDGEMVVAGLTPEGFCSGLRQILELTGSHVQLSTLLTHNRAEIERLKSVVPALRNLRGEHYGDLLERLFLARMERAAQEVPDGARPVTPTASIDVAADVGSDPPCRSLAGAETANAMDAAHGVTAVHPPVSVYPLKPSNLTSGPRIDKAALAIRTVRRLRDKDHLRRVASLPCMVCQAVPSHPHHLTFAQPRGLALKVSDEFVVPLCVEHHNDVHRGGSEPGWWKRLGIEPLSIARELWQRRTLLAEATAAE